MAAVYPGAFTPFKRHVDYTEDVAAADINAIQEEVARLQHVLSDSSVTGSTVIDPRTGLDLRGASTIWPSVAARLDFMTDSLRNHPHDGLSGNKLFAANTHEAPDTDSSNVALHHTLGVGPNQAAPGDHNHDGKYAGLVHTHTISQVNSLQGALDGKAPITHTHPQYVLAPSPTLNDGVRKLFRKDRSDGMHLATTGEGIFARLAQFDANGNQNAGVIVAKADVATVALSSSGSDSADHATTADRATYATSAGSASTATRATTADRATRASIADNSNSLQGMKVARLSTKIYVGTDRRASYTWVFPDGLFSETPTVICQTTGSNYQITVQTQFESKDSITIEMIADNAVPLDRLTDIDRGVRALAIGA